MTGFQHSQMLRNGRPRQGKVACDLSRAQFSPPHEAHDPTPCPIREPAQHRVHGATGERTSYERISLHDAYSPIDRKNSDQALEPMFSGWTAGAVRRLPAGVPYWRFILARRLAKRGSERTRS